MKLLVCNNNYVDVTYTNGAAHISNNTALSNALNNCGSIAIANAVKGMYQSIYGTSLNVWNLSMAIEIIGHYVPDKVSQIILDSPDVPSGLKNAARQIVVRTSVIDSGEEAVDSNRWFWDDIAYITTVAYLIRQLYP